MKPTMRTAARTTKPDDDPWRFGIRHQRVVAPDGTESYEDVPLRAEDLLFPQEGDQLVSTKGHIRDCTYLEQVAEDYADEHADILVFREHRIDFGVKGIEPLCPDLSAFRHAGTWDIERGTFPVKEMRAKPLLVVEVTSPDTRRNDLVLKPDLYYRSKVPLYVIVDRQARRRKAIQLSAFRAIRGGYAPVAPDENGRIWIEPLHLWLGIENDRAICYDENGVRIAPANERARQAQERARQADERARQAEREKADLQKRLAELEARLRRAGNGR